MTIIKIKQGLAWVMLVAALGLVGCSSGGSSKSKDETQAPPPAGGGNNNGGSNNNGNQTSTGVFIDGPVAGVSYTTSPGGKSGVTNLMGEYDYVEGDKVTFRIGGIVFPDIVAKGTVTPLDMGGKDSDLTSATVLNILRLLQTLDDDGDPENGISISGEVATKLEAVQVTDFSNGFDAASADAIKHSTGLELVDDIEAKEHFERSLNNLLEGSWLYVEPDGRNLLTFLPEIGEYLIAHDFDDGETQRPGTVEHGSYEWNVADGKLKVALIAHSDNEGGLIEATSNIMNLKINGDTLTLLVGDDGEAKFTAIRSSESGMIGAWFLPEPDDNNLNVLTIFPNNRYVVVHSNNQVDHSYSREPLALSSEWGSYKMDDKRVEINVPAVETDGEGGLYNENEASPIFDEVRAHLNGDLAFVEEDEAFAFRRLGAFPFALNDGENQRHVIVTRRQGSFKNDVNAAYLMDLPGEGKVTLSLNANGTGTFDMIDTDGSRPVLSWEVNSAGTLLFEEQHILELDPTPWRITPVAGKSGKKVLVEVSATDGSKSFLVDIEDAPN